MNSATHRLFIAGTLALASLVTSTCQPSERTELTLYRARRWRELREVVSPRSSALIRGVVAAAFNDPAHAEQLLRGVIREQPLSPDADDAYALLCDVYIMSGRYSTFVSTHREWGAAFPGSPRYREQQDRVERFGGRPDQIDEPPRPMIVKHEPDAFTVPVTINGKTEDFFLDTGALHSVMTDLEARKLGLTVGNESRLMTGASGDSVRFRTAIAKDVIVGATSFHNVSFAVMEPVGPWRDAEGGIVGLPLFLGLGAIRWSRDGSAELGQMTRTGAANETNLVLDRGRLLMKSEVLGEAVLMALDTGANTTDLNENFATQFKSVVGAAKRTTQDITGVGGTRTFDALELSEVAFTIGPKRVFLRPAKITLQRVAAIGGECCVGNAGRDLLLQFPTVTIDLKTMTLRLQ